MRKKGYQQTIGFLTKYHSSADNDETFVSEIESFNKKNSIAKLDAFNLNDFYLKFSPDKYCEMSVKLKRKNRHFLSNDFISNSNSNITIFQVNIFNSRKSTLNLYLKKKHLN